MESGKFVGHVGGLAVAVGIGAAMAAGSGVAWAGPNGSEGDTSQQGAPAAASESDSAGQQTRDAKSESTGRKGPLSRIGEQVRKTLEGSANSVIKHATRASEGVFDIRSAADNATDEDEREVQIKIRRRPPTAVTPATDVPTTDTETGLLEAVRSSSENSVDLRPARGNDTNVDFDKQRPHPVSALRGWTSTKRADTVAANVEAATKTVVTRGVDSVSATFTTVAESAVNMIPATAVFAVKPTPELRESAPPTAVSRLLAAVGLVTLAGTGPAEPVQSPAMWALLAFARREIGTRTSTEQSALSVADTSRATALIVDPNELAPQPSAPEVGVTKPLGSVTGPAPTGKWYIGGTDLGIMWDDGAGHVLTLFGDTFDDQAMTTGWRFNTLLRTVDNDLSDGLQFDDAVISPGGVYADNTWWSPTSPGQRVGATQVIRDPGFLGLFGSTTTIIPTAAVEVDGVQYANVMSVRTWDTPGRWTTNWSAIAYSQDGGKTWTVDPDTVRSSGWLRSSTPYVPGNQNFQQGAFVKAPEADPETGINYVYSYGTPSGRGGSAYLARVPEGQIRDLDAYEYWAGEDRGWVADDPSAAVPVIGATNQSPPPSGFIGMITKAINDFLGGIVVGGLVGGDVSEMSVQYNDYLDKYIVLYTDGGNNVVMRVSDAPQGEWSDTTVLVANNPLAGDTGMYAPMIHPWSGTEKLGSSNTHILYYNLSYWGEYNVRLMQTDLSPMGPDAGSVGTITV
jgi:hypothetical protein